MRKPAFRIWENKDSDQLRGSHEAEISDFVFATQIVQSLYFLNPKVQASSFCGCTSRFVSDLVGTPEDRFSHNEAQKLFEPRRSKLSLKTF